MRDRVAQGKRGEAFWMHRERGKEMRGVAEAGGSVGGSVGESSLGWGVCVLCGEVGRGVVAAQHSTYRHTHLFVLPSSLLAFLPSSLPPSLPFPILP